LFSMRGKRHDIFIPAFVGDGWAMNGILALVASSMPPGNGLAEVQSNQLKSNEMKWNEMKYFALLQQLRHI
jgi:hypothetical protein